MVAVGDPLPGGIPYGLDRCEKVGCDLLEGLGQTSKGLTKIKIVLSFSTTF